MKNPLFLFALLVCLQVRAQTSVSLIPQPVEIQVFGGNFVVDAKTTISFATPEAKKMADALAQKLDRKSVV